MSLIVRNDEQIKVGTTVGLVAGASTFTFDGTLGKPDYRNFEIVISEISGTGILVKDVDYTWNSTTGLFTLLGGSLFAANQWYNIHFQNLPSVTPVVPSSLIGLDFFVRDINIPNTGNAAIIERLNLFIDKYEPKCLESILGYELYKALLNETSTRITELIVGAEYTDDLGKLRKWQGLVHDNRISLIANYVYYFIQESSATQTTGVSTSVSKTEAGTSVSPATKMIDAWNFFSSEVSDMIIFLWMKKDVSGVRVYPEFDSAQYWNTKENTRPINYFGI